jgi:hypothetical protein
VDRTTHRLRVGSLPGVSEHTRTFGRPAFPLPTAAYLPPAAACLLGWAPMVYTRIVQPGVRSRYWYTPGERTIFRVAGTIIPEVWHMMLFSAMLTYAVCLVYDPLRRAEKKASAGEELATREELALHLFRDMEHVLSYCEPTSHSAS